MENSPQKQINLLFEENKLENNQKLDNPCYFPMPRQTAAVRTASNRVAPQ